MNSYTTIAISYYNLGVEHEHLNEFDKAIEAFNKAL
jgi:tetratricopeptide (TPR) repeat protein